MYSLAGVKKSRSIIAIVLVFCVMFSSIFAILPSINVSAVMPVISLNGKAYGTVTGVTTNLKIRENPTTSARYSGTILNGTKITIVGYTEYDPSDPYSPWLAIDTSSTPLQKPSDYSVGYVSQVYVNVPVTGIRMHQNSLAVKVGTSDELTYSLVPPCANNKNVTWSSSDSSIVNVSKNGEIVANSSGTATITVKTSNGGKTANCVVTVNPLVSSIELSKSTSEIGVGKTEELTCMVLPADAFDKSVTWSSSDNSIVSVSQDGTVTGKAEGFATITATTNDGSNIFASCDYKVLPLVERIAIDKDSITLSTGSSETLSLSVAPEDAFDKTVKWSSSDENIAVVDQYGKVTGVSAGTATITALANDGSGQYDTCSVTVKSLVTSVRLNKNESALIAGQSETLIVTVEPGDALDKSISWSSSDSSVAIVDTNGTVTALTGGQVIITATSNDGSNKSDSCRYTIGWLPSGIALSKTCSTLKSGTSETLTTIFNDDAVDRDVVWSSSDESVALVDQNGTVTAVGAGKAIISATLTNGSGQSASCEYIVKPLVSEIKIDKEKITITAGQSEKLSVSVLPIDAFDSSVMWSSSNISVATVNESGIVKGKLGGTAIITATATDGSGVTAVCEVTVTVPVSRISLNYNTYKLFKGASFSLKATVTPKQASEKRVTWSSNDKSVANVDENGRVIAVKAGTATITATASDGSGVSSSCKIIVVAPVEKIILNKYNLEMSSGEQYKLKATVKPDTATDKTVTWKSSDSAFAYVDENGKVVARSGGKVSITATSNQNSSISATCDIIINYPITGWIANIGYNSTLNIRKTPNVNGEIAATAPYATKLIVTAPAVDGWYPVELSNGTRGYASADYVVFYEPGSLVNTSVNGHLLIIPDPNPLHFTLAGGSGIITVKNYNTGVVLGKPDSFYWDAVKIEAPSWITVTKTAPGIVKVVIGVTDDPRSGTIVFSSPYAGEERWQPAQYE